MRHRDSVGQALVIVTVAMTVLLAMVSLVIDIGVAYWERCRMQGACDAAALAAVLSLPNPYEVEKVAKLWTGLNGFPDTDGNVTVEVTCAPGGNQGQCQVVLRKTVPTFFANVLGVKSFTVDALATAQYRSFLPINIYGMATPTNNGNQSLSLYGPFGAHFNGDPYGVRFLSNGSVNPLYQPDGYQFSVQVPADYYAKNGTHKMKVWVFDPDTNQGGANTDANTCRDENRSGINMPAGQSKRGLFQFSLFAPDSTPNDYTDDTLINSFTANGDNTTSSITYADGSNSTITPNMRWIPLTPVDLDTVDGATYRLNVRGLQGSAENGFNLYAGPPSFNPNQVNASGTYNPTWNSPQTAAVSPMAADGVSADIKALGFCPINFNVSGTININFGDLPAHPGLGVHVQKFDTEVNADHIWYSDSHGTLGSGSPPKIVGTLAANDTFAEDIITLPAGYAGGTLIGNYRAGANDTSVWSMWFDGYVPGTPGRARLVE